MSFAQRLSVPDFPVLFFEILGKQCIGLKQSLARQCNLVAFDVQVSLGLLSGQGF